MNENGCSRWPFLLNKEYETDLTPTNVDRLAGELYELMQLNEERRHLVYQTTRTVVNMWSAPCNKPPQTILAGVDAVRAPEMPILCMTNE